MAGPASRHCGRANAAMKLSVDSPGGTIEFSLAAVPLAAGVVLSRSAGARSGYGHNGRVVGWRNTAARAGWPSRRRPTTDSAHLAAYSGRCWRTRAGGQRSHQPARIVARQAEDPFRGSSSVSRAKIPLQPDRSVAPQSRPERSRCLLSTPDARLGCRRRNAAGGAEPRPPTATSRRHPRSCCRRGAGTRASRDDDSRSPAGERCATFSS